MPPNNLSPTLFRSAVSSSGRRVRMLLFMGVALLLAAWLVPNPVIARLFGFVGAAMLLIFGIAALSREVFELDKGRNRYRKAQALLGQASGEWLPLPAVKAVVLKSFSQYEAPARRRLDTAANGKLAQYYIVMLSVENSAVGIVVHKFNVGQLASAQDVAARLAAYLQVPQLEFPEPE